MNVPVITGSDNIHAYNNIVANLQVHGILEREKADSIGNDLPSSIPHCPSSDPTSPLNDLLPAKNLVSNNTEYNNLMQEKINKATQDKRKKNRKM